MDVLLIGIGLVGGFCLWKFVIQPRMNEGKPIEPAEGHKTFGEQMEEVMDEATNPDTDI